MASHCTLSNTGAIYGSDLRMSVFVLVVSSFSELEICSSEIGFFNSFCSENNDVSVLIFFIDELLLIEDVTKVELILSSFSLRLIV
jgi:hypothetical protein